MSPRYPGTVVPRNLKPENWLPRSPIIRAPIPQKLVRKGPVPRAADIPNYYVPKTHALRKRFLDSGTFQSDTTNFCAMTRIRFKPTTRDDFRDSSAKHLCFRTLHSQDCICGARLKLRNCEVCSPRRCFAFGNPGFRGTDLGFSVLNVLPLGEIRLRIRITVIPRLLRLIGSGIYRDEVSTKSGRPDFPASWIQS